MIPFFLTILLLCPLELFSFLHPRLLGRHYDRTTSGCLFDSNAAAAEGASYLPILAATVAAIPLSIPIDAALQNGYKRIEKIANTRVVDEQGTAYAYIARPKAAEKRPVVVLIHQFFGLTTRDTELCDELARLGYVAVAPDTFQGNTTSVIPRAISFVTEAAYNDNWVVNLRDIRRVVSHLERECGEWADTSRIVVSGFCFGGGLALRYADAFPQNVVGVGMFYGKPLKELSGLHCDVYGVYGDNDRQFPPEMVNTFETLLQSRTPGTVEIRRYPGKAHAFVDDLACINRGGEAGDAWSGFINLLEKKLG